MRYASFTKKINLFCLCCSTKCGNPHQCCQNIIYLKYYTLFWQRVRITLYLYFFQSNTLKILYYRLKLSKRIKSALFILIFLKYLIHVSSLSTNEHIKKNFARAFGVYINNTSIFKPSHSKFMIFYAKIGIWGEYLYVSHTLFILYLEGNHTLFQEKLYFIWKFSSGSTASCLLKAHLGNTSF